MIRELEIKKKRLIELINNNKGENIEEVIKKEIPSDDLYVILLDLFNKEHQDKLINIHFMIKLMNDKIESKTGWKLEDRMSYTKKDEETNTTYRVKRITYEFVPESADYFQTSKEEQEKNEKKCEEELKFWLENKTMLKDLGKLLYFEEFGIEKALTLGLKNEEDYDLAVEIASYLHLLITEKETYKNRNK